VIRYLTMVSFLSSAAEVFPLAFALAMLCVAVFFSMWVVVSNTFRSAQEETENEVGRPDMGNKKSSWIANSVQRLELLVSRSRSASITESITRSDTLHASGSGVEGVEVPYDESAEIRASALQKQQMAAANKKTAATAIPEPSALLSWSQVTCSYPSSKSSDQPFASLRKSFGEMRATELTAIMGGSGSGKSTLLDILSGRKTLGNIEGKLSVLGEVLDDIRAQAEDEGGALRSVAAYVPQQEAFFPTQTAEEAVAFAANLKLGKDPRGDEIRWSRIQSVLREVGLR
jgi:ABC-type glutathione transport system ATPase component